MTRRGNGVGVATSAPPRTAKRGQSAPVRRTAETAPKAVRATACDGGAAGIDLAAPGSDRGRPEAAEIHRTESHRPPDPRCPACRRGDLEPRGGARRKTVWDCPQGSVPVRLTVEFRAWVCPMCGHTIDPKTAWIAPGCTWIEPGVPVTPGLARHLEEELRGGTVADLLRRTGVQHETVTTLIDRIGQDVQHAMAHGLLPPARVVGLDGKKLGNTHHLVAADLERRRLLWCAKGTEDTASVAAFIRSLPGWQDIEVFVCDFAPGFESGIRRAYRGLSQPRIVRCLLHAARGFLDAGHAERRRLARGRARGKLPPLNRIFTMRADRLKPAHRALLRRLRENMPSLFKAYCFKEAVYGLFTPGVTAAIAEARLIRLQRWMERDPEMERVFRKPMETVRKHHEQILSGFAEDCVATNNRTESINGQLDALDRATKGLARRAFARFRVRALLRCGALPPELLDIIRAARLAAYAADAADAETP